MSQREVRIAPDSDLKRTCVLVVPARVSDPQPGKNEGSTKGRGSRIAPFCWPLAYPTINRVEHGNCDVTHTYVERYREGKCKRKLARVKAEGSGCEKGGVRTEKIRNVNV